MTIKSRPVKLHNISGTKNVLTSATFASIFLYIGAIFLSIICLYQAFSLIKTYYKSTQKNIELFENINATASNSTASTAITTSLLLSSQSTPLPFSSSVTILGTARNIEKFLPTTFKKIKMIRDCFKSSNVIIFENDSDDKTLEMLQNWANNDSTIDIITEKGVKGLRTQRLAYGRNKLLQKSLQLNTDYIVILDLDDVNDTLTRDAFLSSFAYPDNDGNYDWAVMTANQSKLYYDLWALRTVDDWMPFDCWGDCVHKQNKGVKWCVDDRFKHIEEHDKPILVKSAFGGLGIYKTKYLQNCTYDGGKDNYELCEHVKLHEDIMRNGGKIYINPKMINSIGK